MNECWCGRCYLMRVICGNVYIWGTNCYWPKSNEVADADSGKGE